MTGMTGCRVPYKQQNGGIKTTKWGIKTTTKYLCLLKSFDIIKTSKRKGVVYERGNTL